MAKCSHCLHWDACSMLFEMAIGRKPTANGNKAEEKCPYFKDKTINTNADRIRAMSDEELADNWMRDFVVCHRCAYRYECECDEYVTHEKCREGIVEWLKQPAAADLIDEDSCTVTLQRWIFTKDAQPSEAGMYLAFADSLFPKGKPRIGTYCWTGSDWLDMLHIPRKVSHWMPLPDPPEGIWL